MFNKLKFNNLVLSNKKGIQLSRIQTINKLVHKIRKLKVLLEKHPDNTKCKERIRKSTETMKILKKLKRLDIMKKILLLDKPAPAVITNGLSTPEELGVALLCMNKVMKGLIKKFRTELELNEVENDEWKQVLMESSKRRQKIEKTEEKRRKRIEMKQQKVMARKRHEWLEENQLEVEEVNEDENLSTTGSWLVKDLSSENGKQNKNDKPLKKLIEEKSVPCLKNPKIIKENKDVTGLVKNKCVEAKISNNETTSENVEINKIASPQNTEKDLDDVMVIDPFFITDTGENYMSTAVIKRNKNDEEKDKSQMNKVSSYNKKPNLVKNRLQSQGRDKNQRDFLQNTQRNNTWNLNKNQINGKDNFLQNKRINNIQRKEKDFRYKTTANNTEEQNVHPSWLAKQKMKPIIIGFQGKKITFDNEDSSYQNKTKLAASKTSKPDQGSLHPSWAAKQKLKPIITTFQGKKITFDNDE